MERLGTYSLKISLIFSIIFIVLPGITLIAGEKTYLLKNFLKDYLFLQHYYIEFYMWIVLLITTLGHELLKVIKQLNNDQNNSIYYYLMLPFGYVVNNFIYYGLPIIRLCLLFVFDGKARFILIIISIFLG